MVQFIPHTFRISKDHNLVELERRAEISLGYTGSIADLASNNCRFDCTISANNGAQACVAFAAETSTAAKSFQKLKFFEDEYLPGLDVSKFHPMKIQVLQ
jgi:hypothetical protein